MGQPQKSGNRTGYIRLLKDNKPFRNLWYGQVISELGDWLNSLAIYALILKMGGSGTAMAGAMVAKLVPIFFVSPIAGVMIDRFPRKSVMIVSDILRFVVVLGFLLVGGQEDLWLLYSLIVIEISLAGFFEPARSAIIPSIVATKDLVTANALSGSTWSVMLAFGAALGGVVVSLLGIQAAFILDAVTFLFSAWFIARIPAAADTVRKPGEHEASGWENFVEGARYILVRPVILALTLLKSGLAISGGAMTLIPLFANRLFSSASAISMSIGILYSARGIGAAVGPILVKHLFGDSSRMLRISIFVCFLLSAASYILLARSNSLFSACTGIGMATLFGSVIWVFSSSLIHLEAEQKFLGRIFSTEMGLLTLVMGLSNWGVGYAVDHLSLSLSAVTLWMAGLLTIPGLLWGGFIGIGSGRLKQGTCSTTECPVDASGFNPLPIKPRSKQETASDRKTESA